MPRPSAGLPSSWIAISLLYVAVVVICIGQSTGGDAKNKEGTDGGESVNATSKKNYTLTGIPQIDYVHDPNLPRELNGYNLSDYPFFYKVPEKIAFKCDGRKDGFYASIEHKCQLYHHCLFENRYDFLCPNYTAFDQSTFICQFVSEVDCPNSELFFHRNNALYVAKETTTVTPYRIAPAWANTGRKRGKNGGRAPIPVPTVSTAAPNPASPAAPAAAAASVPAAPAAPETAPVEADAGDVYDYDEYDELPRRPRVRPGKRGRRPWRLRRPKRPYYRDYDYYWGDYYDEFDDVPRRPKRPRRPKYRLDEYDYEDEAPVKERRLNKRLEAKNRGETDDEEIAPSPRPGGKQRQFESEKTSPSSPSTTTTTTTTEEPYDPEALARKRDDLLTSSRPPPKIKPPVPRAIVNNNQGRPSTGSDLNSRTSASKSTSSDSSSKSSPKAPVPSSDEFSDTYYDERERQPAPAIQSSKYVPFSSSSKSSTKSTTTTTTTTTAKPVSAEAPVEYEYYEYEYEQVETKPTTTTTTTTTTATPKTTRSKFRSGRRQEDTIPSQTAYASPEIKKDGFTGQDVVGSTRSTPVVKHTQINGALEAPSKVPSLRQPYLNRPRPSFTAFLSKNGGTATTSTTTTEPPPVSSSFSGSVEKYYDDYYQTEKSSSAQQSGSDEYTTKQAQSVATTTPRGRTTRFRGRPAVTPRPTLATTTAIYTTSRTTTTPASAQDTSDYAYYEDSLPFGRYGQRQQAPSYQQDSSASEDYQSDSAPAPAQAPSPPPPAPAPVNPVRSTTTLRINERERYNTASTASASPSPATLSTAGRSIINSRYNTNNGGAKSLDQSNLVTPYNFPPPPKTTPLTFLHFQEAKKKPQESGRNPPEYISLLPEDEEAYYASPGSNSNHNLMPMMFPPSPLVADAQMSSSQQVATDSRYGSQVVRMFPVSQEYYPTYAPPPPPPQNYVKVVRPRHVYPTMFFPPFGGYQ